MKYLAFIFVLALAVSGNAATWYISTGGDGTTGADWTHAFTDMDSINVNHSGGDTIFMHGNLRVRELHPKDGTYGDRTYFIAGNGTDNTPTIAGCTLTTAQQFTTGWNNYSGYVYSHYYFPTDTLGEGGSKDSKAWCIYQKSADTMLYVTASSVAGVIDAVIDTTYDYDTISTDPLEIDTSIASIDSVPGIAYHDEVNDSIYCWFYNNANPNTDTVEVSSSPAIEIYGSQGSYCTFWGIVGRYASTGWLHRIADSNTDSMIIDRCDIGWVAGEGADNVACIRLFQGSITDSSLNSHWTTIRACTLSHVQEASDFTDHYKGVSVYGEHHGLVESCYVGPWLGTGVDWKTNQGGVESWWNVTRFNTFYECAEGINIYCHAGYDSIYGNLFIDCDHSGSGLGIVNRGLSNKTTDGNHFIGNNTFINGERDFATGTEDTTFGDNWFKYNICTGTSSRHILSYISDTAYWTYDSNYYYPDGASIFYKGTNYNFAGWQAADEDLNSTLANPYLNGSYEPDSLSAWNTPITYGGRTWYGPGAVQTLWEPTEAGGSAIEGKSAVSGKAKIE